MTINLYKNHSEHIVANKTLTDEAHVVGNLLTENVSVLRPVIEVFGNPSAYNYCYISDFERYYYIEDVQIITNDHYMLTLKCDVLMSHLNAIKANDAIISRNKDNVMSYIDDGEYTTERRMRIQAKGLPTDDGGTVHALSGATYFLETF